MELLAVFVICFAIVDSFYIDEQLRSEDDLSYKLCRSQSDCGENYCCAMRKMTHQYGFCMPTKALGDRCTPSYLYGTSFTCGCQIGLTCALVEKNKITNKLSHRCVEIPPEPKENTEAEEELLTESGENILTATELSRLLNLLNHKPKRKKV